MTPSRLSADEARAHLAGLPQWRHDEQRGAIARQFDFADFIDAFAFMTEVALWAEKRNHHPEWSNVYSRVSVTLTTHDVSGLSMNDIELARLMDHAFARRTGMNPTGEGTTPC
jgi:4a-hydroxytetrahydrobiopterin dehydratase